VSLFGRWPVANRATQVGGWPVFTWPNVPATGLTSQAHVDAPLIGSATLNAEISRLTYVSQLVESNKGAIFAARERLGTPDSLIRDKEKPGHQRGRRGF
jgi:hypothetical protein